MTTIVNTPAPAVQSDQGMGMIIGFIILSATFLIFFAYVLPAIRRMGSPQINIPSKIDVNINQLNK